MPRAESAFSNSSHGLPTTKNVVTCLQQRGREVSDVLLLTTVSKSRRNEHHAHILGPSTLGLVAVEYDPSEFTELLDKVDTSSVGAGGLS